MTALRDMLTQLGFTDVRSVLQSGNLLFRSRTQPGAVLERMLEQEASQRLELQTDFFVRTAAEWQALVSDNPFPQEAEQAPGHLVMMCLKDAPATQAVKVLQASITGSERLRVIGREAFIVYPDGIGRSRVTNALIERKLDTRGTARNWNTVLKLNTAFVSDG